MIDESNTHAVIQLHGIIEQLYLLNIYDTPLTITRKLHESKEIPIVNGEVEYIFINNGRILSPSLSLNMQGIKEKDVIYIIRKSNQQKMPIPENRPKPTRKLNEESYKERLMKHFGNRFKETDVVFEQMTFAHNPKAKQEFARLNDLFKTKVECNPISYRKICTHYARSQGLAPSPTKPEKFPTVIPQNPIEPSNQELPPLFSNI